MAETTRNFRTKLRGEPTKKFVILADLETHEVSSISRAWLDYENGRFKYPTSTKALRKLLKAGEAPPEEWPWYRVECIFNETDDYNESKEMINKACGYVSETVQNDETILCSESIVDDAANLERKKKKKKVTNDQIMTMERDTTPKSSSFGKERMIRFPNQNNSSTLSTKRSAMPVKNWNGEENDDDRPKKNRVSEVGERPGSSAEGTDEANRRYSVTSEHSIGNQCKTCCCKCTERMANVETNVLWIKNFLEETFVTRANAIYRKSPQKVNPDARVQKALCLPICNDSDFDSIELKMKDPNSAYVKNLKDYWLEKITPRLDKIKEVYAILFASVFPKDALSDIYRTFTISGQKEKRSLKGSNLFLRMKEFLEANSHSYVEHDFENYGRMFLKGKSDYARAQTQKFSIIQNKFRSRDPQLLSTLPPSQPSSTPPPIPPLSTPSSFQQPPSPFQQPPSSFQQPASSFQPPLSLQFQPSLLSSSNPELSSTLPPGQPPSTPPPIPPLSTPSSFQPPPSSTLPLYQPPSTPPTYQPLLTPPSFPLSFMIPEYQSSNQPKSPTAVVPMGNIDL